MAHTPLADILKEFDPESGEGLSEYITPEDMKQATTALFNNADEALTEIGHASALSGAHDLVTHIATLEQRINKLEANPVPDYKDVPVELNFSGSYVRALFFQTGQTEGFDPLDGTPFTVRLVFKQGENEANYTGGNEKSQGAYGANDAGNFAPLINTNGKDAVVVATVLTWLKTGAILTWKYDNTDAAKPMFVLQSVAHHDTQADVDQGDEPAQGDS